MKKTTKKWTSVEEYFLIGNYNKLSKSELVKEIGCTLKELNQKTKELKLDEVEVKQEKNGLNGFITNEDKSVLIYTGKRALQDDKDAGITPVELGGVVKNKPVNKNLEKFKINK